jgi:hypothetical protein
VTAVMSRPRVLPRPRVLLATAPPDNAVLTPKQLAAWFQISERQVDRIDGLPYVLFGGSRSKRHPVRLVLRWLETLERRQEGHP